MKCERNCGIVQVAYVLENVATDSISGYEIIHNKSTNRFLLALVIAGHRAIFWNRDIITILLLTTKDKLAEKLNDIQCLDKEDQGLP